MSCIGVRIWLYQEHIGKARRPFMYVCNCNGLRERQVRAAIEAGAARPAEVFKANGCSPRCARCVCEMRDMIDESREALRYAAE